MTVRMEMRGNDSQNSERFRAIYAAHASLVRAVIYNICGGRDLDDLAQEAFLKVWRGLAGFRNDSQIGTWIYRVAANTALDHCRKKPMPVSEIELEELPGGVSADDDATLRDLVQKGMRRLSPEHRAVVTLCVFEELTTKEAAEALGSPEGTVKSRLHYAKGQMARFFENSGVKV